MKMNFKLLTRSVSHILKFMRFFSTLLNRKYVLGKYPRVGVSFIEQYCLFKSQMVRGSIVMYINSRLHGIMKITGAGIIDNAVGCSLGVYLIFWPDIELISEEFFGFIWIFPQDSGSYCSSCLSHINISSGKRLVGCQEMAYWLHFVWLVCSDFSASVQMISPLLRRCDRKMCCRAFLILFRVSDVEEGKGIINVFSVFVLFPEPSPRDKLFTIKPQ